MIIRGADALEEARASVPAVVAIKRGRPDAHVTMAAAEEQREFWKTVPEVDEFIGIEPGESASSVAEKIRMRGRFDAGILFSPEERAAQEFLEANVRYRIGPPCRFRLNDWKNAPGLQDPPESGAERYKRIANGIGGVVE
jgi:ADP-heptose:LPS heptosyltransferase